MRKKLTFASLAAVSALAVAAPGASAQLSGNTVVNAVAASVIAVTPDAAVTFGTVTPGSATPATVDGNVLVLSNTCYDLSATGTKLTSGAQTFTNAIDVKLSTGATFNPLDPVTALTLVDNDSNAVLGTDTWTVNYRQVLAGETVAPGAYAGLVTYTGAAC